MKRGKTFLELVHKEAVALKENATKEELNRLEWKWVDADSRTDCIYGQMTGNCHSERAMDLMELSCERVLTGNGCIKVNGPLTSSMRELRESRKANPFWSPIEAYIAKEVHNEDWDGTATRRVKRLVDFLQGRTETFKP